MCLLDGKGFQYSNRCDAFLQRLRHATGALHPYTGVLAIFASRLLNNNSPMIFEDGLQRRDFVHVTDVARACHLALNAEKAASEIFNIGSGESISVAEVAEQLATALGKSRIAPTLTRKFRVGDIRHCFADIGKAQRILGYRPEVTLADGMAELTDWLDGQIAVDRVDQASSELAQRGLAV